MLGLFTNEVPVVPIPTRLGPLGSEVTREKTTVTTIQRLQRMFVKQYTDTWEAHRGYPTYEMVTPILSGQKFTMSFINPRSIPTVALRNNPAVTATGTDKMAQERARRNYKRRPLNTDYDKAFYAQRYNPVNLFTRGDGAGVKVPLNVPFLNPAKEALKRVRWAEKPEDLRATVTLAQSPQQRQIPDLFGNHRRVVQQ